MGVGAGVFAGSGVVGTGVGVGVVCAGSDAGVGSGDVVVVDSGVGDGIDVGDVLDCIR